jgi:hypothetical protein
MSNPPPPPVLFLSSSNPSPSDSIESCLDFELSRTIDQRGGKRLSADHDAALLFVKSAAVSPFSLSGGLKLSEVTEETLNGACNDMAEKLLSSQQVSCQRLKDLIRNKKLLLVE